jgi:hypothetical protein
LDRLASEKTIVEERRYASKEMESCVMCRKSSADPDSAGFLVGGLVALVLGLLVLVPSLLSYLDVVAADKEASRRAHEIGLQEIPGVTAHDLLAFFLFLTIYGGAMIACGVIFMLLALSKRRKSEVDQVSSRRSP